MSGKLVEIDEIIPLLKKGWVACDDENGTGWYWYENKPDLSAHFVGEWDSKGGRCACLSCAFNIKKFKGDYRDSLRRVE